MFNYFFVGFKEKQVIKRRVLDKNHHFSYLVDFFLQFVLRYPYFAVGHSLQRQNGVLHVLEAGFHVSFELVVVGCRSVALLFQSSVNFVLEFLRKKLAKLINEEEEEKEIELIYIC